MAKTTFKDIQAVAYDQGVSIERYKTSRNLYVVSLPEQESVIVKFKIKLSDFLDYLAQNSFEDLVANYKATDAEIEKYESKYRPIDFDAIEKKLENAFQSANEAIQAALEADAEGVDLAILVQQAKDEIAQIEQQAKELQEEAKEQEVQEEASA